MINILFRRPTSSLKSIKLCLLSCKPSSSTWRSEKLVAARRPFSKGPSGQVQQKQQPPSTTTTTPTPNNASTSNEALIKELNAKMAENKLKNLLIYSCSKDGSVVVNVMGLVGGVLLLAASWSTWNLFSSFRFRTRSIENENGLFRTVLEIIGSEYFKISLCSVICIVGVISMIGSIFMTIRSINKLYLLKGGKSIGVITDGVFGKRMSYVFELGETDFMSSRRSRSPQITLKNKKHYFYFIINNVDGVFHEKSLFDNVICTRR